MTHLEHTYISGLFSENIHKSEMLLSEWPDQILKMEKRLQLTQFSTDHAGDGILWLDAQGKVVYGNNAATELLGYSNEELLQMAIWDLNPERTIENWESRWKDYKAQKIFRTQPEFIRKDGHKIPLENTCRYLTFNDHEYVCIFLRDFSQRKKIEAQLIEAKESALEASHLKSDFLAKMSHEIRTPMSSILGLTEMVLEDHEKAQNLTEEQQDYLKTVQTCTYNLVNLMNDILDISKIEAGILELPCSQFNLEQSIQEILKPLKTSAQEKAIKVEYTIDPKIPEEIIGTPHRLSQVLTNLVNNAIRHNENQATISLNIQIDSSSEDQMAVLFEVQDTGKGIPPEQLENIFKPYTRIEKQQTQNRTPGAGLGLAIASQLVDLMGGLLEVKSQVGEGTTFFFTLNFGLSEEKFLQEQLEKNTLKPTHNRTDNHSEGHFKILLAEDNDVNQKVMCKMLNRRGHEITLASNGQEALEHYENSNFDIILMDIQMPVMDGLEATQAIKKIQKETGHYTPIIAVTANVMTHDCKKYLEIGIDDIVGKPTNFKELETKIVRWVSQS